MNPTDHKAVLRALHEMDGCEASRKAADHIEYLERRLISARDYEEQLRRKLNKVRHQRNELRRQLEQKNGFLDHDIADHTADNAAVVLECGDGMSDFGRTVEGDQ